MFRVSTVATGFRALVAIPFVALATTGYGQEQSKNQPYPDRIEQLRVESDIVDLAIQETAPDSIFRRGPCIVITGILEAANGQELPRLWDFELQRQEASNPKTADAKQKWESVSIRKAVKVLEEVRFVPDPLPKSNSDTVFTMPLPQRRVRDWSKELVVHPYFDKPGKHLNVRQFRFIDFHVRPEKYYRYRVRLELLIDKEKRLLPYSNPSAFMKSAVVPHISHFSKSKK